MNIRPPVYEEIHHFRGLWNCEAVCRLTIWRKSDTALIVMLTELPDNPGTSVTNFYERLATELYPKIQLFFKREPDPHKITWIEHYERDSRSPLAESWDEVTLSWNGQRFSEPKWKHLSEEKFENLIQGGILR